MKRNKKVLPVENTLESSDDLLTIKPLGAGQEVGRSCILLSYKKKNIMLDCGIHPGLNGLASLPFFDACDPSSIDLLLISHFHLDHIAALPYFMEKTTFRGKVFMTHPTKAIYKSLLSDFVKISKISTEDMLFDENDLDRCMEKIETMNYHQQIDVNGIRFIPYNAGHVLGAAMIEIEIAGVRILYTGDYSREDDRHLMAAEIPPIRPDILIIESTYGTEVHEPREEREHRFITTVEEIVLRGGRCLIPVLALGRAQELLLILDEYWEQTPSLQSVPIYYASALANQCMSVYQTYIHMMNNKIQEQFEISEKNPFCFKHIKSLKGIQHFSDSGPAVFFASPGMLQSGNSRKLFDRWCSNPKNGCVICGYCVEGTLAKQLIQVGNITEITTFDEGIKKPLKMSVSEISFAAHADYTQTSQFIEALLPSHVILVHGEFGMMTKLKVALEKTYEEKDDVQMIVYSPKNTEVVNLYFRGEKKAKVLGTLAQFEPTNNTYVSGLLVKKKFNYFLLDSEDLEEYSGLPVMDIIQCQFIQYHFPFSLLKTYLSAMFTNLQYSCVNDENQFIKVFDSIIITKKSDELLSLEWPANSINDMIADSVIATLLQIELSPLTAKLIGSRCSHSTPKTFNSEDSLEECIENIEIGPKDCNLLDKLHSNRGSQQLKNVILEYFSQNFQNVSFLKENIKQDAVNASINNGSVRNDSFSENSSETIIVIDSGSSKALLDLNTMDVKTNDSVLQQQVRNVCLHLETIFGTL